MTTFYIIMRSRNKVKHAKNKNQPGQFVLLVHIRSPHFNYDSLWKKSSAMAESQIQSHNFTSDPIAVCICQRGLVHRLWWITIKHSNTLYHSEQSMIMNIICLVLMKMRKCQTEWMMIMIDWLCTKKIGKFLNEWKTVAINVNNLLFNGSVCVRVKNILMKL